VRLICSGKPDLSRRLSARSSADAKIARNASRWTRIRRVANAISGTSGSQDTMQPGSASAWS